MPSDGSFRYTRKRSPQRLERGRRGPSDGGKDSKLTSLSRLSNAVTALGNSLACRKTMRASTPFSQPSTLRAKVPTFTPLTHILSRSLPGLNRQI